MEWGEGCDDVRRNGRGIDLDSTPNHKSVKHLAGVGVVAEEFVVKFDGME